MNMNLVKCLALLLVWHAHSVSGRHANCHFLYELQVAEKECFYVLADDFPPHTKGCRGMWDNISCWHHAKIGEVVVNTCPAALKNLFTRDGTIKRNCTTEGWSDVYPSIQSVCSEKTSDTKKNHCVWTLRTFQDPEPFSACIYASWDYLWGRDHVCAHLEMRART